MTENEPRELPNLSRNHSQDGPSLWRRRQSADAKATVYDHKRINRGKKDAVTQQS
jgi:hypothetical protein